jgi:hypothetical protein
MIKLKGLLSEKNDKYENDVEGYIDDVLAKMSRRELEREHGEYYHSSGLSKSTDRTLMISIIAGRWGRGTAQRYAGYID